MRLHAARRTAPSNRSQRDGVRLQRADGENARRQSERNHSVCEHGSCWQQSGLRRLTLLPDTVILAFRKPDPPGWLGGIPGQRSDAEVGRASRHVGENRLGNRRQRQTRVRHRERANKQKRREHQDLRMERRCGSEVLVLHQTVRRREYVDSNCIAFRNPAVEAAVYEQQPHSVSGRSHRHGQRQRQVRRQRSTELHDGG